MSSAATDAPGLQGLRAEGHRAGALAIHPYFGRVDPVLARTLIEEHSAPGDRVLDPFCGSGTVLHEALLCGRSASGWDASPLAVGITLGKLAAPTAEEVAELEALAAELRPYARSAGLLRTPVPPATELPEMPRVTSVASWFSAVALDELALVKRQLLERERDLPAVSRLLAWLAFSRIVTRASNQQGESSYRRVDKEHAAGTVVELYLRSVRDVAKAAGALSAALPARTAAELRLAGGRLAWADREADVRVRDARQAHDARDRPCDLVVSSPPYLMSWDYGLYHKFRFYWLGLDLDTYEESEIGRHLRRRNDDVERYCSDMAQTFRALDRQLAAGATIALINAPSVVHGELVDTNRLLETCAAEAGWRLRRCTPSIELTGPHHGMYASLPARSAETAGAAGKREHVLVFTRAAG